MQLLFSHGIVSRYLVTILTSISLDECVKECADISRCGTLLYERRSKVCELHESMAARTDNIIKRPGFVVVTDIEHSDNCRVDDDCVPNYIRECPHPKYLRGYSNTTLKGNIFSVNTGVTVNIHLQSTPKSLTCSASGEWKMVPEPEFCSECQDCTDFARNGFNDSTIYYVNKTFYFLCTFDDTGHWLTFQRRFDGSVDFSRNWTEYETGFGHMEGEFWLGLDTLFRILKTHPGEYELRVDLEKFDGREFYATYSTFDLSDADHNYMLTLGGYNGTAGDDLHYHNEMPFTTSDRDNDLYNGNCALRFFGGWWYNACQWSNLNGKYYANDGWTPKAGGLHWVYLTGYYRSMKTTEMKIRRRLP